jgi:hypothetical protein
MTEWTQRLVDDEKNAQPEIIEGIYYTTSPKTLFAFLHRQIDFVNEIQAQPVRSLSLFLFVCRFDMLFLICTSFQITNFFLFFLFVCFFFSFFI